MTHLLNLLSAAQQWPLCAGKVVRILVSDNGYGCPRVSIQICSSNSFKLTSGKSALRFIPKLHQRKIRTLQSASSRTGTKGLSTGNQGGGLCVCASVC